MNRAICIIWGLLLCSVVQGQAQQSPVLDTIKQELAQKARDGVLNMMDPNKVSDAMLRELHAYKEGELFKIPAPQSDWNEQNVSLITDAFNEYLDKLKGDFDSRKINIVKEHVQDLSAFKSAVYSSFPPSPEVGKVIGMSTAIVIRWFLDPEVQYPSEESREAAKQEIRDYFSALEKIMVENFPHKKTVVAIDMKTLIHEEIEKYVESYMWKVDSPFFTHGKRVLGKELSDIMTVSFNELKEDIQSGKFDIPERYHPSPAPIRDDIYRMSIRNAIRNAKHYLLDAYGVNFKRPFSNEENNEIKRLLESAKKF